MKAFNNMKLAIKLTGSFLLVALVVLVVAVVGFINLKKIDDGMISLYINRTLPIQQLGFESTALYTLRGDVYKSMAIPVEREASLKAIQVDISVLEQQKSFYDAGFKEVDEKAEAANFSSAWTTYKNDVLAAVDSIKSGNEEEVKQSLIDGPLHTSRAAAATSLSKLIEINRASAEALNTLGNATFEVSITILVVVTLAGLLLAIGLGLFLSRNLANAIKLMVKVANQISQTDLPAFETVTAAIAAGDLTKSISVITQTVNSDSKDEIGDLARAFNAMIIRLQGVGKNFTEMIANLSSIVGQVAENATTLDAASGQLSTAANQAGQATSQISVTIQQVASGISQQTESVSRTAASVDEMGHAIETVARGAQEQAKAVAKASTITSKISAAVQQVTASAQISAQGSNQAADTARSGAETVEGTIRGMQTIKRKVGISANKVQEMGMRSDEIGAIVETIDDIASQTNLLALNAAIEAARAGEHGKGFAVVADEVRKLAERSSNATKEIGKLIRGIQQTMAEAVTSIEEVTHEVESGVERASQSEEALKSILNAVEAVNEQVEQIAAASQHISVSADELVAAVDTVSAVVQENTAATQHMSVDSGAVTQAIENIASVSEENSASVEEVSASTEEMSAQVEEVSASAQTLAEMAKNLTEIVAQFRLAPGISSLDGELPSHSVASKPNVQGLGGNGNSKHQPDGQAKPVLSK